jgi:hypothetical protein
MAGHTDDGTVREDKAHHEGRKVDFSHHTLRAGTPHERTYKYTLSVKGENGPDSRRVVGASDLGSMSSHFQHMAKVDRSSAYPGTSYEYTELPEEK